MSFEQLLEELDRVREKRDREDGEYFYSSIGPIRLHKSTTLERPVRARIIPREAQPCIIGGPDPKMEAFQKSVEAFQRDMERFQRNLEAINSAIV